jgi:iron complex transport system ATP-binding protein
MSRIEVTALSASLGGRAVLHDIAFAAGEGTLIGLIGPNGAGKSTLLKAMLGLTPASGSVKLAGRDASSLTATERARLAAYLPQDRDIAWPLTAEAVVALGRIPHRAPFAPMRRDDLAAIEAAMIAADIAHLRARPVLDMSGGERARVLIARALAQDAPILMADEPVAGLDPAHQIALMEIFAKLAAKGRTVIITLHELHLAARWCHRLLLLDRGRLIADGDPAMVLSEVQIAQVYGVRAYRSTSEGRPILVPVERLNTGRGEER